MYMLSVAVFHPGLIWAAAGLALVPLIIYLLNRRRYREVPWAAMQFLLAANHKSHRRTRLEQLLLLILRTVIISGIAVALARPFWPSSAAPKILGGSRHHILLLDDSASMSARLPVTPDQTDTTTLFDWQITRALQLLDEVPAGDPVTLITLSQPARILSRSLLFDRSLASRVVQELAPGEGVNDLAGALQLINELPAEETDRQRALYLFSDFTTGYRGPVDESQLAVMRQQVQKLQQESELVLFDVGVEQQDNLAMVEWRAAHAVVGPGEPLTLIGRVHNFGTHRHEPMRVEIRLDDQLLREEALPAIEAGADHIFQSTIIPERSEWEVLSARIATGVADALSGDDQRPAVLQVREEIPVLLVDGEPGREALLGQCGYLLTAWSPQLRPDEPVLVRSQIAVETELIGLALDRYAAVAICNVRRLPAEVWHKLHEYVQNGGGLMIFVGDQVDISHYNETAGDWLPARLGAAAFEQPGRDEFVRFDPRSLAEPMQADFAGRERSGLFLARIDQYLRVEGSQSSRGAELMRYTNGDPALLSRTLGAGRVVLVTTSANMEWNNLPAKGDFVTLAVNLLRYVVADGARFNNLTVADRYLCPARQLEAAGLVNSKLLSPDGRESTPELRRDERGYYLQTEPLLSSGWYRLRFGGSEEPIAVRRNLADSDLARISESEIRTLFPEPIEIRHVSPGSTTTLIQQRQEASAVMIYALILLLLVETLLAMLFGHQK
ncbi:MAG: hypothetical protein HJJLKODD_01778 [Phycisphaerae bacterium]|nr:hypothetical protein [Phycisphaerae bacterium]